MAEVITPEKYAAFSAESKFLTVNVKRALADFVCLYDNRMHLNATQRERYETARRVVWSCATADIKHERDLRGLYKLAKTGLETEFSGVPLFDAENTCFKSYTPPFTTYV